MKQIVYVCSPFRGDEEKNTEKARIYSRQLIKKGLIPFAPHLLFPQFLDDKDEEERALALEMNLTFLKHCEALWVFGNKISEGMQQEIDAAAELGIPVHYVKEGI
jgi:hypothetical protein